MLSWTREDRIISLRKGIATIINCGGQLDKLIPKYAAQTYGLPIPTVEVELSHHTQEDCGK